MISEKTVELNLTIEFVNWLKYHTKNYPFILAPSQSDEGALGFDVSISSSILGIPILIQYKRAEKLKSGKYKYKINYTSKQDQHLRLQYLQKKGFLVFYAFPIFHQVNEIINYRRKLLTKTGFITPLSIKFSSGPIGHHTVYYEPYTNVWSAKSDEIELKKPIDYKELYNTYLINKTDEIAYEKNMQSIGKFLIECNKVLFSRFEYKNKLFPEPDDDVTLGLFALVL